MWQKFNREIHVIAQNVKNFAINFQEFIINNTQANIQSIVCR